MGLAHPKSWDLYTPRDSIQIIDSQKGPPFIINHIFSVSPRQRFLVYGLRSGVFSVPGIYIETYAYDDVYVRLLMKSFFCTSGRFPGNYILGTQVPNISFPRKFTKK